VELNILGYQLIAAKKFKEAIGIFQLNVEAYPKSSNAYDSLGEAYMDIGRKPEAITNYGKSLELNPKNRNAAKMLQKLNVPEELPANRSDPRTTPECRTRNGGAKLREQALTRGVNDAKGWQTRTALLMEGRSCLLLK